MVELHAACILIVPVGTALLLWLCGVERPEFADRGLWAIAAGVAWFVLRVATTAGTPWYPTWQWALPGICMLASVLFLRSGRTAAVAAIIIAACGIGLIEHAWSFQRDIDRVHRAYFNGLSDEVFDLVHAKGVVSEFEMKTGNSMLPPASEGWLEEAYPTCRELIAERYLGETSDKYGRRWHSRLTGLLEPVGTQRLGIWITSSGEVTVRAR